MVSETTLFVIIKIACENNQDSLIKLTPVIHAMWMVVVIVNQ
jgi:hypothetical protein